MLRHAIWACLLGMAGLWAQDSRLNIAVGDFEANGVPFSDVNILTDRLRGELMNTGVFRVMERSQMEAILKEQSFQESGACNTSECQVKVGQLLSVDRMVVGTIGLLGGSTYTVSARMLDVGTGEVLSAVNAEHKGDISEVLSQTIPEIAQKLSAQDTVAPQPVDPYAGKTGDLFIATAQPGATVLLDGQPVQGSTPLMLNKIAAGPHRIRVSLGNTAGEQDTLVPPDGLVKIKIPLSALTGKLKVITNPPGMKVYLDGTKLGSSPTLTDDVYVGKHDLVLTSKEYLPLRIPVAVKANEMTTVDTTLIGSPKLSMDIAPSNAQVVLGEDSFPEWTGYRYVPKGPLQLTVSRSGYKPHEELLDVTQDLSKSISLEKIKTPLKRKIAYALLGLGAVSGGAGYLFDTKVKGYKDDYEAALDKSTGEVAWDNMHDFYTYRNVSYGIATVAVVTGVVLFLLPD
ncbi:MAG TPA: PEGA domain-containing protein [Fibrobacteraceae bacterium]|nr:PEGA domain-containing protein [Fibrobacteraceae bacterium]